jgi:hypothetical protein
VSSRDRLGGNFRRDSERMEAPDMTFLIGFAAGLLVMAVITHRR